VSKTGSGLIYLLSFEVIKVSIFFIIKAIYRLFPPLFVPSFVPSPLLQASLPLFLYFSLYLSLPLSTIPPPSILISKKLQLI